MISFLKLTKFINWRVIAVIFIVIIIIGGWYLSIKRGQKIAELQDELEFQRTKIDTMIIEGTVIEKRDTVKVIRRATKWKTIVSADTIIQIHQDTVLMKITSSGTVEIDTTIINKLNFWGKIWYPSGRSLLTFKFHPPPKPKSRRWFAGIGVGYSDDHSFALADVSYRRVGIGILASGNEIGGYLRLNF